MSAEIVSAGEPDYVASCEASADKLIVRSLKRDADGSVVLVIVTPAGLAQSVVLSSAAARPLAAAILNHADRLDGVTPLSFFPPGAATGVYPDGHPDK